MEYILCLVWMGCGVSFYSFVVGSVTSIIAAETRNKETLSHKLKALDSFQKETGLPEEIYNLISQFLLNNYDEVFSKTDEQDLLDVLPTSLREEVLYH